MSGYGTSATVNSTTKDLTCLKMLFVVWILTSIFCDIQAKCINETNFFSHEIYKREIPKACLGETVQDCQKHEPKKVEQCKVCGLSTVQGIEHTIINGEIVKPPNRYPWMVALLKAGKRKCGGSILSDSWILTAAHCLLRKQGEMEYLDPKNVQIEFLTPNTKISRTGSPVEKLVPHPDFRIHHMKHDIALIKLKKNITCNEYKNPICLPPADFKVEKNTKFIIAGWGTTNGTFPNYPKELHEAEIKSKDFAECSKKGFEELKDLAYCLSEAKGRPCFGDSGGPMFLYEKSKKYVITLGVASYHSCEQCSADKPFVYTAVPPHIPWIKDVSGISPPSN